MFGGGDDDDGIDHPDDGDDACDSEDDECDDGHDDDDGGRDDADDPVLLLMTVMTGGAARMTGPAAPRQLQQLVHWTNGLPAGSLATSLVHWSTGPLVHQLVHWSTAGPPIGALALTLVHWSTGPPAVPLALTLVYQMVHWYLCWGDAELRSLGNV